MDALPARKRQRIGALVIFLLPVLMVVHSFVYKESRYERLKAEFGRMRTGERKRHRIVFWVFLAVTVPVIYITYRLFCRFGGQFLLPG